MDILAHFLWTFAIFFRIKKERWRAGFFGVMPDMLSFGPHLVLSLIAGSLAFGKPNIASIPDSVFFLYDLTHSLVIFIFVMVIIYFVFRRVYWFMLGWGLHILIDIPTHSKEFFATPFLWPVSDFRVDGISWGAPWFMIVNYAALVIVYWYLLLSSQRKHFKKKLV